MGCSLSSFVSASISHWERCFSAFIGKALVLVYQVPTEYQPLCKSHKAALDSFRSQILPLSTAFPMVQTPLFITRANRGLGLGPLIRYLSLPSHNAIKTCIRTPSHSAQTTHQINHLDIIIVKAGICNGRPSITDTSKIETLSD